MDLRRSELRLVGKAPRWRSFLQPASHHWLYSFAHLASQSSPATASIHATHEQVSHTNIYTHTYIYIYTYTAACWLHSARLVGFFLAPVGAVALVALVTCYSVSSDGATREPKYIHTHTYVYIYIYAKVSQQPPLRFRSRWASDSPRLPDFHVS